jgi:hypothetical protein
MLRSGRLDYGQVRDLQTAQLQVLTYAALLWQLFRTLIEGALPMNRERFVAANWRLPLTGVWQKSPPIAGALFRLNTIAFALSLTMPHAVFPYLCVLFLLKPHHFNNQSGFLKDTPTMCGLL